MYFLKNFYETESGCTVKLQVQGTELYREIGTVELYAIDSLVTQKCINKKKINRNNYLLTTITYSCL